MGMDLKPIQPTKDAPRHPDNDQFDPGGVVWGRYNWSGWSWLMQHLEEWGVLTDEFKDCNDGDRISAKTCRAVADALEKHLPELNETERRWLEPHIQRWRTCGGYRQY